MPAAPAYVATGFQTTRFVVGGGYPDITPLGVYITDQPTMDAVFTAAGRAGIRLLVSGTPFSNNTALPPYFTSAAMRLPDLSELPGQSPKMRNEFDRHLSLYNGKPGNLRKLRAALEKARAGAGYCQIGIASDSIGVYGTNTFSLLWPQQLKSLLMNAGYPSGGSGFVPAYCNLDPAVYPRGWTIPGYGASNWFALNGLFTAPVPGLFSNWLYNPAGNTGVATFAPLADYSGSAPVGTFAELLYNLTVQMNVDGAGFVDLPGLANPGIYSVPVASGTHTIACRAQGAGGATAEIIAARVRSAYGIEIHNFGISGSMSGDWAYSNTACVGDSLGILPLDALIYTLQTNDIDLNVPVDTFIANIQTGLAKYTSHPDLIFVLAGPQGLGFNHDPYRSALFDLADTLDARVVDITHRWGNDFNAANAAGHYVDTLHLSATGHAATARTIFNAIMAG
jgi:lysophospholipase L1-like esterase